MAHAAEQSAGSPVQLDMNDCVRKWIALVTAIPAVALAEPVSEVGAEWGKRYLLAMLKEGSGFLRPGFSVVADESCNFTVTGHYTEARSNAWTGEFERSSFLARYSPAQTLAWGMVLSNAWTLHAATAPGRDIFVAGAFTTALRIGAKHFTSRGRADLFVARCDANGNFRWARHAGGAGSDYPFAVAASGSGECFVVGAFFNGDALFENTALPAQTTRDGGCNLFLAKYDADGRLLWARRDGGGSAHMRGCTVDKSGNLYVTGCFFGSTRIGKRSLSTQPDQNEFFLAKYDPAGQPLWVATSSGPGNREGHNVAINRAGEPHVVGITRGGLRFGGREIPIESLQDTNLFLAKYSPKGEFQWARQFRRGDFDFSNVVCNGLRSAISSDRPDGKVGRSARRSGSASNELASVAVPSLENPSVRTDGIVPGQSPSLSLRRSGGQIILSWPGEFADFVLEASDTLLPFPLWETVFARRESSGDQVSVIVPMDRAMRFYRIRKP
jgi:hypothetical protein